MDVTPLIRQGQQIIQSYSNGTFRVSGVVYTGAVIVAPEATVAWDIAKSFDDLTIDDFVTLTPALSLKGEGALDVILVGTGKAMKIPGTELRAALKEQGLHVEFMDTGAACRTYNVLMAEGRRVVAALLPFS